MIGECYVENVDPWRPEEATPKTVMSRFLIILGIVLLAVGFLWPWLGKLGLGRLPGDIVIERENFRLYVPLMTSLVISVVLSLILWWPNR